MLIFLPQICIALEAVLLNTQRKHSIIHAKLAPEWVLFLVNFDPLQKIGPKVGGGHSFEDGRSFARLQYIACPHFEVGRGYVTTCD